MPTWLYHITHVQNLASITSQSKLCCDRLLDEHGLARIEIAYQTLKAKRSGRQVPLPPGGALDDYVPFYFAPRSPMLFAISRDQIPGYNEGQRSVVHLVLAAEDVVALNLPFVFTDGHAYMEISSYFNNLADLSKIDWTIMKELYWTDTPEDGDRRRRRQAEFLVYREVPWSLVRGIGVIDNQIAEEVQKVIKDVNHQPKVVIRPQWYY
ncbi:MAG: DUF4433 domain-containing protein [Roseiflexaceae bacterium]